MNFSKNLVLKNGKTATIKNGDTAFVLGLAEWTKLTSQYTSEEIEARNTRKKMAADKLGKPVYLEDSNRLYTEVVVDRLRFVDAKDFFTGNITPRDEVSDLEHYIVDCSYDTRRDSGRKYSAKNRTQKSLEEPDPTPTVSILTESGFVEVKGSELVGEMAPGTVVVLKLRALVDEDSKIGITLEKVYLVGEPKYFNPPADIMAYRIAKANAILSKLA